MSSTQKNMFEGVGAPVNVAQTDGCSDPTLDSCCQREIESNRKRDAVETALRSHDRVARAEDRRRRPLPQSSPAGVGYNAYNLVPGLSFGSGCRCCYDPDGDGGEYELLAEAKRERGADAAAGVDNIDDAEEEDARRTMLDDEDGSDSDSDGEFDYLLEEDVLICGDVSSGYDDFQSQRRSELEDAARHHEVARHHGYGVHRQMHPQRIFAAAGLGADKLRDTIPPKGAVVHLYDAQSPLSVSLDLCLEEMVGRHAGTKFVRGIGVTSLLFAEDDDGDSGWKGRGDLPMLLALRDGRVVAYSSGLRDFCSGGSGSTEVESDAVERWLDRAGALHAAPPPLDTLCRIRPEEEALLENMRKLNGLGGGAGMLGAATGELGRRKGEDMDDDEERRYDCGVSGCNKCFYHEHVGVKNDAQDGLLVPESEVAS